MSKGSSKAGSKNSPEQLFRAKEEWHGRQAKMSLTRKIKVMDRLLDSSKSLPRGEARMIPTHNRIEARVETQHWMAQVPPKPVFEFTFSPEETGNSPEAYTGEERNSWT
jgi:hypothetical protein